MVGPKAMIDLVVKNIILYSATMKKSLESHVQECDASSSHWKVVLCNKELVRFLFFFSEGWSIKRQSSIGHSSSGGVC